MGYMMTISYEVMKFVSGLLMTTLPMVGAVSFAVLGHTEWKSSRPFSLFLFFLSGVFIIIALAIVLSWIGMV